MEKEQLNREVASISLADVVTVTKMGHITEIQYMQKVNRSATIKKLSKDKYCDLATGEIKEFKHMDVRTDSYNSLRQTFKKLRYLINNNFRGRKNELFVTLTFKPDETGWRPMVGDNKYLSKCFTAFNRKLQAKYGKENVQFIRVLEPHADGHAHYHVLLRFDGYKSIYIPNDELAEMWGQGLVTVHSLKNVDNIGAYVSAYLTDVEFNEETDAATVFKAMQEDRQLEIKKVDGEEKKFIKGGRLHMYPSGKQIYNKSKDMSMPERERMTYKKAKKIVGSAEPHYSKKYEIESDDFSNTIIFQQYNSERL